MHAMMLCSGKERIGNEAKEVKQSKERGNHHDDDGNEREERKQFAPS